MYSLFLPKVFPSWCNFYYLYLALLFEWNRLNRFCRVWLSVDLRNKLGHYWKFWRSHTFGNWPRFLLAFCSWIKFRLNDDVLGVDANSSTQTRDGDFDRALHKQEMEILTGLCFQMTVKLLKAIYEFSEE